MIVAATFIPSAVDIFYNRFNVLISRAAEKWTLLNLTLIREDGQM